MCYLMLSWRLKSLMVNMKVGSINRLHILGLVILFNKFHPIMFVQWKNLYLGPKELTKSSYYHEVSRQANLKWLLENRSLFIILLRRHLYGLLIAWSTTGR